MATRFGPFGAYGSTGTSEDADRRERAERDARPIRDRALKAIEDRKIEALADALGLPGDKLVRVRAAIRANAEIETRLAWELFARDVEETLRDGEASQETYGLWDALITGTVNRDQVAA